MTSHREWLFSLDDVRRAAVIAGLTSEERAFFRYHWTLWARCSQVPPPGDWRVWLICAGRGFGKTRAGAEWVRAMARSNPDARIALVAATLAEARAVMVEGESGLLAVCPPRHRPVFEPSLRRITWPNGAQAMLYSAAEPESLRGPQSSHAWCDEIAKWDQSGNRAMSAWHNLKLGLRLGKDPKVLATTTPRPVPLMINLLAGEQDGETAVTRGSTYDNAQNLPPAFIADMRRSLGKTALGRQELDGELLQEAEGALWTRAGLESCREGSGAKLQRVVVGVDPPASQRGDACGIVVAGLGEDGIARIIADCSILRPSPERWARAVAAAALTWEADRVVAEANQGGDMVGSVLRAADLSMPVKLVHASRGKTARAEPIAAMYEAGRVRHAGTFPQLEDEMCAITTGGDYSGPSRSPDRADALVWALTELMLGARGAPRIWVQ